MTMVRSVSTMVVVSFLLTALPRGVWANNEAGVSGSLGLRAAIDRAAAEYAARSVQSPSKDVSMAKAAAPARQGGRGGGSSMLIWTLVGTAASVATTYFVIKEVRKQTEQAGEQ
jgi:hypothetical protein